MQPNVVKYNQYRPKQTKKISRSLYLLILTLLCLGIMSIYLASPLALVAEVKVTGANLTDPDHLLQTAGLAAGQHMWQLNLGEKRDKLLADPWLAHVAINRQLPNRLVVEVTERVPLVAVGIKGGGWLPLAADGTVLTYRRDMSLPFLTGVEVEPIEPGNQLSEQAVALALEVVAELEPLADELSEVNADGLPLYFSLFTNDGYRIEIWVGDDYKARTEDLVALLAEVRRQGVLGTIDLRTRSGQAIFRPYNR